MSLLGKPTTSSWRPCSSPSAWRGSTRPSRSSPPGCAHSEYGRTKYSLRSLRSSQNTPACTYNGSTYYYGSTYYGSTYLLWHYSLRQVRSSQNKPVFFLLALAEHGRLDQVSIAIVSIAIVSIALVSIAIVSIA